MSSPAAPAARKDREISKLLVKNTTLLMGAQILSMPLSIAITALLGRYLGPEDFGAMYLAGTFCAFGFLVVEWGQGGALTALIARDRSRAGDLLGTGLVFRLPLAGVVYGVLAGLAHLLGYPPRFQWILALVAASQWLGTLAGSYLNAIRGFERTDIAAGVHVGQQFVTAALLAAVLWLGGRLGAALSAQVFVGLIVLLVVSRTRSFVGIGRLGFQLSTLKELLREGSPFLLLGVSMALQPNIDAFFLSRYASPEAVGWHAAANKLVGTLLMPVSTLVAALYPTLCRLHATDRAAFLRTTQGAISTTSLLVVPIALGCGLFPDLGIRLLGQDSFEPAEMNLRILAVFLFLVYFTMTLGVSLIAAGHQKAWSITQFLCVVVSLIVDPFLVPYFQSRYGNGGLGVCVAVVFSEMLMLGVGLFLAPRGVFERGLFRLLGSALVGGLAMAGAARLLSGVSIFIAAPLAILAYVAGLAVSGGLSRERLSLLHDIISKKAGRA